MKASTNPRKARIAVWAIPLAGMALAPPSIAAVPDSITSRTTAIAIVEVSLADRTITLRAGDEVLGTWPIASSEPGHPTPPGNFQIRRIVWNPGQTPPVANDSSTTRPATHDRANPAGAVKIYFREPAYYIHGTDDNGSIGLAASHGCIRMRDEDAIALATLVMEHGGEPRSPNWFQRVLNRVTQSREIRLSTPVRILIS